MRGHGFFCMILSTSYLYYSMHIICIHIIFVRTVRTSRFLRACLNRRRYATLLYIPIPLSRLQRAQLQIGRCRDCISSNLVSSSTVMVDGTLLLSTETDLLYCEF